MPAFLRAACVLVLASWACVVPAARARTVTDQLNRTVTVPDEVRRVVALQHQSLDIVVELGAADRLVGVLRSWPSLLPGIERLAPVVATLPTPATWRRSTSNPCWPCTRTWCSRPITRRLR